MIELSSLYRSKTGKIGSNWALPSVTVTFNRSRRPARTLRFDPWRRLSERPREKASKVGLCCSKSRAMTSSG